MSTTAGLFLFFCALGLFAGLLHWGLIGENKFFWLVVVLVVTLSVIVMGPNMLEVNIGGNTLKGNNILDTTK